jgi:hypothetical protein
VNRGSAPCGENGEAARGPSDSPRLAAAARRQTHDHNRARFARAPRLRILSLMSDVQLSTAPYRAGAWNAAAESPACFVKPAAANLLGSLGKPLRMTPILGVTAYAVHNWV